MEKLPKKRMFAFLLESDSRFGFTLIECMIYLVISTLLMGYISMYFLQTYQHARIQDQKIHELLSEWMVNQRFVDDIRQAQADKKWWDFSGTSSLVVRVGKEDVGWKLSGDKIMRSHGSYDYAAHQWVHQKKICLATGFKKLTLMPKTKDSMSPLGVHMNYNYAGVIRSLVVMSNNGRITR